jgi:hypothetical protein
MATFTIPTAEIAFKEASAVCKALHAMAKGNDIIVFGQDKDRYAVVAARLRNVIARQSLYLHKDRLDRMDMIDDVQNRMLAANAITIMGRRDAHDLLANQWRGNSSYFEILALPKMFERDAEYGSLPKTPLTSPKIALAAVGLDPDGAGLDEVLAEALAQRGAA